MLLDGGHGLVYPKRDIVQPMAPRFAFDSAMQYISEPLEFGFHRLKDEKMFFSASYDFVLQNADPITSQILEQFPDDWKDCIIDSRVHMLMKGWFPCIPGFHHDDVPRGLDGQPNYVNPEYRSEHLMILVNGEICPTVFAIGKAEMPEVLRGEIIYKHWHQEVESQIALGSLESVEAQSNRLIYFDWQSFHTGQRAKADGWRMFLRASRKTKREVLNEIRHQVQVYLEFPMEGW